MHRPYAPRRRILPNLLKEKFYGDFEYFVTQAPQPQLCFGSTTERECLPVAGPNLSPFMRRIVPDVNKDVGPNSYEGGKDAAFRDVTNRPCSKYGLGPRAPRFAPKREYHPPFQEPPKPKPWKQNCAPFNSTAKLKRSLLSTTSNNPAPCNYYPKIKKRQMKFHYSFQGKKTLVCPVRIKCVPYNLDVCEHCGVSCSQEGDYWSYEDRIHLCRKHYDQLFVHCLSKFQGLPLIEFKPVRDCFFAHSHNSCKAALKIMTNEDILKKLRKEAYLDVYFPLRRICE